MCSAFTKNFEQTTTEYSFFMSDFVSHVCLQKFSVPRICNNDLLDLTVVLLNLVALPDSTVPSPDFEQINIF